jgi:hypothetical protein
VADEYSNTRVIGMDLVPIQPAFVPGNCEFIVGDLNSELVSFLAGSFDLIHARLCPRKGNPDQKISTFRDYGRAVGTVYW